MAVIAHTVAMGCAEDVINCSCPDKEGGCPDPVSYGLHIARTFLNLRYSSQGGGLKQRLVLHNYQAAQHVSLLAIAACKITCCVSHSAMRLLHAMVTAVSERYWM
jgi:hypothetical protein